MWAKVVLKQSSSPWGFSTNIVNSYYHIGTVGICMIYCHLVIISLNWPFSTLTSVYPFLVLKDNHPLLFLLGYQHAVPSIFSSDVKTLDPTLSPSCILFYLIFLRAKIPWKFYHPSVFLLSFLNLSQLCINPYLPYSNSALSKVPQYIIPVYDREFSLSSM